jgi:hypothetical protein
MEQFFRENCPENGVAEEFKPLVIRLLPFVFIERRVGESLGQKCWVFEFVTNAALKVQDLLSLALVLAWLLLFSQERHELPDEPHY